MVGGGRAVIFGGGKTVAVLDRPCPFLMIVHFFFYVNQNLETLLRGSPSLAIIEWSPYL